MDEGVITAEEKFMKHILITGASQGIGLEFSRQYLHQGFRVYAASRQADISRDLLGLKTEYNDHLFIFQLDVGDEESRADFYAELSEKTGVLDLLINNAGIISGNEQFNYPFGKLDQEEMCKTLLINSVAPLMMAEIVHSLLVNGSKSVVVNITSDNGSITRRAVGGKYSYCVSKAALNMVTKILSFDMNGDGIIVVSLHPGWVKTPMTRHENAPLEPAESINGMIQVIDSLGLEDTGRFLDWKRNEIPW
jgi:NAD(P)-dependent dehydrogenase (short-subunit alcohol dehydrogenase family)